ncbi:MAG: DinB family protein [Chryseolinea sp.]
MKNTVQELEQIINQFKVKISAFSDAEFATKPLPNKWSKKEVLGHLIDSAHNNLRRFICGQYETTPSKIAYDQDFWVAANNYQHISKEDVIQLWVLMNKQIATVLLQMNESNYANVSNVGKTEIKLYSLQFLAEDYVRHLKHHLNQIIPGSFDIVYS